MDFELSEDQTALRDAASALLEDLSPIVRVRKVASTDEHLDEELWSSMAEQGWMAVERPSTDGGLGLGTVEMAVLCEQLGRHLAPVPFTGTVLAAGALARSVSSGELPASDLLGDLDAAGWTERLCAGQAIGAVSWSRRPEALVAEPGAGSGEWRLSGRGDPVVYAPCADLVVVFAQGPDGLAIYALVHNGAERPRAEPAMDVTRSVSWIELSGAPAHRIGGSEAAESLLDRAASVSSAEMLGSANRVLEMSVEYAKSRVQFGRPIGSFQAVKHRCADMLVDVEGMRSSAYYAAWAVGASDPQARTAASAAKVWCSDASSRVMASALQVHGGIGFTWEHDLHLFLKRAQLDQVSFGDATFHRERLARLLRPRAEAGLPIL